MKQIDNVVLASETAMAYVENLASQKKEEHSYYDEEEDVDKFTDDYQDIYDEIYDLILNKLENE
tara:strand:+ start:6759 stop:6950 length:192 start_codon:yes stop_codon:yes gene_type:complete